tara:strand:- start:19 stop:1017 length:999 start_codon:yes stop_codon:yes gene_type:complete
MGNIIVLEGPDAVGKTSLAEAFKKYSDKPVKYVHLNYRWKDKIFDYHTATIKLASRWAYQGYNVIIDRWWPSEACYSTIYRGGSPWPLQGRMHDRVMLKYAGHYVYCLPDDDTLSRFEELKTQRDEYADEIEDLCEMYKDLYFGNRTTKNKGNFAHKLIKSGGVGSLPYTHMYTINRWGRHLKEYVEYVLDQATRWREKQWPKALNPDYHNFLGYLPKAKYLFIGEQVKPKKHVYWPFIEYKNSSLHITKSLDELWFNEIDGIWANAYDENGNPNHDLAELISLNPKIKVLLLGRSAEKVADVFGIQGKKINHPQWFRRFNEDLTSALKEVI